MKCTVQRNVHLLAVSQSLSLCGLFAEHDMYRMLVAVY